MKPWNKGKKLSPTHIENLRKSHLGQVGPWTGKKRPNMMGLNNPNGGKFGKNHPCFKEIKVHHFQKTIRELFKYRLWRSDIFTRDNFTCVLCGIKGGYLNADHFPKRFIDILKEYKIDTLEKAIECEELWNINNGRTLCRQCHEKTDTWGRRKK